MALFDSLQAWFRADGFSLLSLVTVVMVAHVVGGFIIRRLIRRVVDRTGLRHKWPRKDIDKRKATAAALFRNIWNVLTVIVIALAAIYILVPNAQAVLAPMFASAGIIGVAIGFGAQSLVKDFLSGIFIIAENQYRVGDVVEISGATGTVERIGIRSTVLRDIDGNVHYFPNGIVQHVVNKTMGFSVPRFSIALDAQADLDTAIGVINSVGGRLAEEPTWQHKIIDPPHFASVGDISGQAIELIIVGRTQPADQWAVTAEMRRRLIEALRDQNITLAD